MWIYYHQYVPSCTQMFANTHKVSDWALPCPTKRRPLGPCQMKVETLQDSLLVYLYGCCHSLRRTIVQTVLQKTESEINPKKGLGHWILVFHLTPCLERQGTVTGIHMTSSWRCYKTMNWFLCQDQLNTEIFIIPKKQPLFLPHITPEKNFYSKNPRNIKQKLFGGGRGGNIDLVLVCWVGFLGFFFLSPLEGECFYKRTKCNHKDIWRSQWGSLWLLTCL